jgi:hypothetical protein
MGEESPKPANPPTGEVFLSYASQDAEAAQRICVGNRAGFEVSDLSFPFVPTKTVPNSHFLK